MLRKNVGSQFVFFGLVNATTGAPLSGATVTGKRARDGNAQEAVVGTFTDLTNGQYRFNADATDTNGDYVGYLFTATNAIPVSANFITTGGNFADSVRFGLTALPNAAAAANGGLPTVDALNAVKMQSGTGANQLNITAGVVQSDVALWKTLVPNGLFSGRIDAKVGAMDPNVLTGNALDTTAATKIRSLANGTADSGTTTTMVDSARIEADTDYWKGALLVFTSGNISGQAHLITAFNAATDTITFSPAVTQAVSTQTYEIWPDNGGSAGVAADVNLVSIGGQSIVGNQATLTLKELNIQNNAGTALTCKATGGTGHGIDCLGSGSFGNGINTIGSSTVATTGGHGIFCEAGVLVGSNRAGMVVEGRGTGPGLLARGDTTALTIGSGAEFTGSSSGHGIAASGGGTAGNGIVAQANNASGNGIRTLAGSGSTGHGISAEGGGGTAGNPCGHGIRALGGAQTGTRTAAGQGIDSTGGTGATTAGGDGLMATAGVGTAASHGIDALGAAVGGVGIKATGGSGAASHGMHLIGGTGSGSGLLAIGGTAGGSGIEGDGTANQVGLQAAGNGTAAGLQVIGGTTGHGATFRAGSTGVGDGIQAKGAAGAATTGVAAGITAYGASFAAAAGGHGIVSAGGTGSGGANAGGSGLQVTGATGATVAVGGHGVQALGAQAGHGISTTGGAAASGSSAGHGLNAQGGVGTTIDAGHGIRGTGGTASGGNAAGGSGVSVVGSAGFSAGASGHGLRAVGNQGGRGISAIGGSSGSGAELVAGGGTQSGLILTATSAGTALSTVVGTGTHLTPALVQEIVNAMLNEALGSHTTADTAGEVLATLKKIARNRWKIVANQLLFYDNDGTTVTRTFNLFDSGGLPTMTTPFERVPV